MFRFNDVILAVVLCASFNWAKEMTEIEALGAKPNHCTYEYAFDMYGAYCAGLRLTKMPKLKTAIQILDFSDNKLKEIHADTLSGYSSLLFLYLADNQIYRIDDDALSSLTRLVTLDLSNNVILTLPTPVLQLLSLRKLYLKGNPMYQMSTKQNPARFSVKAPIEHLDISDCAIKELPNWGHLPQLTFYNISRNPLISLPTNHFTTMCNLQKVDITEAIDNIKTCDLKPAILWLREKRVNFVLGNTVGDYDKLNTQEFEECKVNENMQVHNITFHTCKAQYLEVQNIRASRRTWLTVGGSLAGFLVGFMLVLYVMHRHNVAQTRTTAEKIKQATPPKDGDKRASAGLLYNAA